MDFNNVITPIEHIRSALRIAGVAENKRGRETGPLNYHVSFINSTPFPMTIVDRYGFRHVIMPNQYRTRDQGLSIFVSFSVSNDGWNNIWHYLSCVKDGTYAALRAIKDKWEERTRINPAYPRICSDIPAQHQSISKSFTIEYMVDVAHFNDHSSVYQRDTDFVISRHDILSAPPHPHSEDAVSINRDILEGVDGTSANAYIQYELITERGKPMQDRFVAVSNKVFTIRAKTDDRRKPGLYLTTTERDLEHPDRSKVTCSVYAHEEMESALNIYKTPEEALAGGDLKTVRKEQLADLEHNLLVFKSENERMRAEAERLKAERESEHREREAAHREREANIREREHEHRTEILTLSAMLEKSQIQNKLINESLDEMRQKTKMANDALEEERLARIQATKDAYAAAELARKAAFAEAQMKNEMTSLARKDHYDQRSTARKDSSEIIKFLPAAVLGIGTLCAAIYKLFF